MAAKKSREFSRAIRKARVRRSVRGTDQTPRLCVFRSLRYTTAQLVSDDGGKVLAALSTKDLRAEGKSGQCVESAKLLGMKLAELAREKKVQQVVFDRNGYIYHGRIKAVAEGAREAGLKF